MVDNTARPAVSRPLDLWDYPADFAGGLRLVVNNLVLCNNKATETDLPTSSEIAPEPEKIGPIAQGDVSQKNFEAEITVPGAKTGEQLTVKIAPKVDLRLKELMVQRDERLKRVKPWK